MEEPGFPRGVGVPTPEWGEYLLIIIIYCMFDIIFAENSMKVEKVDWEGAHVLAPPTSATENVISIQAP